MDDNGNNGRSSEIIDSHQGGTEGRKSLGKHEEGISMMEVSPFMIERISFLMSIDDVIRKVMIGAAETGQKMGDAVIICMQFLVIERKRLIDEIDNLKKK